VPKDALHAQHLLRIHAAGNAQLQQQLRELYGTIRAERNPQREAVIRQVREHLAARAGDPLRGVEVFRRLCAPCHRIYGEGNDVGPDLTRNGRASLAQLLSNVLDPNLVIGEAYQTRIVVTVDGRVITGLLVEETPQRVVLKVQGGTLESIARQDVDDMQVSPISLMPEGLEKQLSLEELADLFAFLRLDKPPTDPTARPIPDE
jgi:putative heme-binding domain-containing protein